MAGSSARVWLGIYHQAAARLRSDHRPSKLMPAPTSNLQLNYLPRLPCRKDFRIGCVGAGFIMRDCHLVAYRQAGFHPVAIASQDPAHARAVAELHRIPRCYDTVAELLADPTVEVLDIGVPPDVQPAVIRAAV